MPITVRANPTLVAWSHFRVVDSIPGSSENAQINPIISGLQSLRPERTPGGRFRMPSLTLTVGINPRETMVLSTADQSSELLGHEQGHYNIMILAARAMARDLESLETATVTDLATQMQQTQTTHGTRAQSLQDEYDRQTEHGNNRSQQARWDAAISQSLAEARPTRLMDLPL